ncbi:hypothetical protein J6590_047535 [Homalodisca vitripennis]|nr:hypothetical protein J6590_047535 [Homalodisca vitripennis]
MQSWGAGNQWRHCIIQQPSAVGPGEEGVAPRQPNHSSVNTIMSPSADSADRTPEGEKNIIRLFKAQSNTVTIVAGLLATVSKQARPQSLGTIFHGRFTAPIGRTTEVCDRWNEVRKRVIRSYRWV